MRASRIALWLSLLAAACGGPDPRAATPSPEPPSLPPSNSTPPVEGPGPVPIEQVRVRLVRVATLEQPLAMAVREGDPSLYVAEKTGRVMAIRDGSVDPRPVLDLSGRVSLGGEQGLLGLVFSPDGSYLYVNLTDVRGDTHVTEFEMGPERARAGSGRDVLFVDQPFSNHNGGNLAFGPDGYLYIGLGDGGSSGDPFDNAQSLDTVLGKMLRIDPRPEGGRPYAIPEDNPFIGEGDARSEIWAYGLRHPWRYSFDRETGDLWIGDVGQAAREEIDFQPASSAGGENYGWNVFEGTLPFIGGGLPDAVRPILDYGRDLGATVIGGYVYRGSDMPGLQGAYVFGDFFQPSIRAIVREGRRVADSAELGVFVQNLSSFGEDLDGELYALSLSGPVYKLAPAV
jgi:glucose/arabinose dehydrogenase